MNINFWLNGVNRHAEISPDTLLIDFLRKQGCFSVKKAAKLRTVVFAQFLWTVIPCFPAVHFQPH